MKNRIAAIDTALENRSRLTWNELGFNPTFGQAYLYSLEAGNDLPNFGEVIWDSEIEQIIADCRKTGTTEFTVSSTFSMAVSMAAMRFFMVFSSCLSGSCPFRCVHISV